MRLLLMLVGVAIVTGTTMFLQAQGLSWRMIGEVWVGSFPENWVPRFLLWLGPSIMMTSWYLICLASPRGE